jgi:AraC family transcriptional regulator of adaptative response/methylated-DNA-[protein]-cysteine methyltransferase
VGVFHVGCYFAGNMKSLLANDVDTGSVSGFRERRRVMKGSVSVVMNGAEAETSIDYQRIEKAISYLQSHFVEQPDLAAVARSVHLSEYHFQRLFTRWAGVSPKRFLQFLTVEYAKRRLAESKSVLEVTFDAGLSSPGRLHDLFVSVEAVTPGEFKNGRGEIEISYGTHASPFGTCLIGVTKRGVCWLSFVGSTSPGSAIRELKEHWNGAVFCERPEVTGPVATRVFEALGGKGAAPLSVLVVGTNFQIKVWQALLTVPPGAVVTYDELGKTIGNTRSARAIGNAVANNRIAGLIPCHRVIRKSGLLGGYRWGEVRKRAMLGWEAARYAA